MTTDARLLAGSVGKTRVAALAMQLVGAGSLGLDEPVSRWLGVEPWFDRLPNARDLTERMLMRHTNGLVRSEFDPEVTRIMTAQFFPRYLTEMRCYPDHRIALALQFNTSVGRAIGRSPVTLLHGFARSVAAALRAGA